MKRQPLEILKKEALKYNTRGDFQKYSPTLYRAAHRSPHFEEICSHMKPVRTHWTDEMLEIEARKYPTRSEFERGNKNAYQIAVKRGKEFMDRICAHMRTPRGSSLAERELFSIIKGIYPEAKKIRDYTVKIEGRSYIHGFEIDILIGNKGIEFDGNYHHSFKYMRANNRRKHWPDEAFHNYHKIKDAWFASKGIQILHIKEADWNKNKESCIDMCLNFLKD